MLRVAALQFASGTDVDENLSTCLSMIDRAARSRCELMVLPEFCNHISWYDDARHAWSVSLDLEGSFLQAIAGRARQHACYIVINVSLRRSGGVLTVTSLMFGPQGQLLAEADKQTLMGHENFWFQRASSTSPVVDTPEGRLAMFPCRDGVTFETPRGLALRGAQLFCDSLNSFARDEATLHVPARAPENRVFLAAANKVGPLIPEPLLQAVSEQTHIPQMFLYGAGQSQIVSPSGEVLALGPLEGEAVVWADVDLSEADNKFRADGTHIFAARRPELYRPIAEQPVEATTGEAAEVIKVACLSPNSRDEAALEELRQLVSGLDAGTELAVLPELFFLDWKVTTDVAKAARLSLKALEVLQACCEDRPSLSLCTSVLVECGDGHGLAAVLVGEGGVVASQLQLHASNRFPGLQYGGSLNVVSLPWGKLALLTHDDAMFPELVKVAALRGVHALAVPAALQEPWEETWALRSRSAENRICLIASSRPLGERAGLIADLEKDFTLMTDWQTRKFDGYINSPIITEQTPGATTVSAEIHPAAACNKLMSEQTDLLLDRPWHLSGGLVELRIHD